MANVFSGTATTSDTTLTTDQPCKEFYVKNTGSEGLRVNVDALHGTDFDTLAGGDTEYYAATTAAGIQVVTVKTDSSTTTYTAGITAK